LQIAREQKEGGQEYKDSFHKLEGDYSLSGTGPMWRVTTNKTVQLLGSSARMALYGSLATCCKSILHAHYCLMGRDSNCPDNMGMKKMRSRLPLRRDQEIPEPFPHYTCDGTQGAGFEVVPVFLAQSISSPPALK